MGWPDTRPDGRGCRAGQTQGDTCRPLPAGRTPAECAGPVAAAPGAAGRHVPGPPGLGSRATARRRELRQRQLAWLRRQSPAPSTPAARPPRSRAETPPRVAAACARACGLESAGDGGQLASADCSSDGHVSEGGRAGPLPPAPTGRVWPKNRTDIEDRLSVLDRVYDLVLGAAVEERAIGAGDVDGLMDELAEQVLSFWVQGAAATEADARPGPETLVPARSALHSGLRASQGAPAWGKRRTRAGQRPCSCK